MAGSQGPSEFVQGACAEGGLAPQESATGIDDQPLLGQEGLGMRRGPLLTRSLLQRYALKRGLGWQFGEPRGAPYSSCGVCWVTYHVIPGIDERLFLLLPLAAALFKVHLSAGGQNQGS